MKLLFLGYVVSKEKAIKLSGISIAGNKMQYNVLKYLDSYSEIELSAITICPVAVFPHDKTLYVKNEDIPICDNIISRKVSFINLPVIKHFTQALSVYRAAKKIIRHDNDTIVFTFNLFPQIGIPMMILKKKFGCKTISLLADLPIDEKPVRNRISKFLRKRFDNLTIKAINHCDNFILLNKYVAEYYNINKKYIVIDGGVDEEDIEQSYESYKPQKHNIVYSGALTEYSGIKLLISAIKNASKDIYLDIYGDGYLKNEIEELISNSDNIIYHGRVSNSQMIRIQKEAWLLVNPRIINDKISRVTFPSKIFEYMLSSTPVLSSKLNGFDSEYDKYLFFYNDDDSIAILNAIENISKISIDSLSDFGKKAREFVIINRSWKIQTEKIYNFLLNI